MVELHVRTRSGVLIPDIVVHRDNSAWIIDIAISADNDVNDSRYNQKVQHYSDDDLKAEVSSITKCSKIQVGAIVFNWRGTPSKKTLTQDPEDSSFCYQIIICSYS